MTIAQVETFRVDYPVVGYFKFFEQPAGRPPCRPTIVIKLTTANGIVGWGQAVPSPRWSYETPETVESTIEHYLAPLLIGADPGDIDGIHDRMNRAIAPSFSTGQPIAKSGIDLALFDLAGRLGGGPACGVEDPRTADASVKLSWTINVAHPDEVGAQIAAATAQGYVSFNIKVAPDLKLDLEICRLVKALAPAAFIWADANGGYDEVTAATAAHQYADLGLAALEQPLPANRLTGYQRLVQSAALPIAMDEGIVSRIDLEEFCRLKALSGVAIKVARCGGLSEAARIVELAKNEGLYLLGSGLTDPDIALAASLRLFARCGLSAPAALNAPQYLAASILEKPLFVIAGGIAPPPGPGLGIAVDEAKLTALSPSHTHPIRAR
jgi:L-alanine-DL-glutamate epimerase-like enolase superfamily enzyme